LLSLEFLRGCGGLEIPDIAVGAKIVKTGMGPLASFLFTSAEQPRDHQKSETKNRATAIRCHGTLLFSTTP